MTHPNIPPTAMYFAWFVLGAIVGASLI